MLNEIEKKQLAAKIAKVASKIVPELVELTKGTEFSLTFLDDGEGFGMIINVSNVPQMVSIIIPELLKKEHEDILPIEEESLRIEEGENQRLAKALQKTNGDKRKAAELVGLSERTFNRKLKEYRIELSKH